MLRFFFIIYHNADSPEAMKSLLCSRRHRCINDSSLLIFDKLLSISHSSASLNENALCWVVKVWKMSFILCVYLAFLPNQVFAPLYKRASKKGKQEIAKSTRLYSYHQSFFYLLMEEREEGTENLSWATGSVELNNFA